MSIEAAQMERKLLMKSAVKVGLIFLRGQKLKTWEKKSAVLSKGYLYIFAKPKDAEASASFWVKNSTIANVDERVSGMKHSFQIKNKYTDIFIAFEKPEVGQGWIQEIVNMSKKKDQIDLLGIQDNHPQSRPASEDQLKQLQHS